jgi:hypothetical protein
VHQSLNKAREHFRYSPEYDDFLEYKEDLIRKFVDLHTNITDPGETALLRESLGRELAAYEAANDEQILASRSVEDERRRAQAQEIVKVEGLFYERINADYKHRDLVLQHPLEAAFSLVPVSSTPEGGLSQNGRPVVRRTRLMPQPAVPLIPGASQGIAETLQAAGVVGLWKTRVLEKLKSVAS